MGIHQGQIGEELSSVEELKASNRRRMIILSYKRHRGEYPGLEDFHACESFLSEGNGIPELWEALRQPCSERFPNSSRVSSTDFDLRAYLLAMADLLAGQKATVGDFVRHLYQTAFRRQADEDGFAHWLGLLVNGHMKANQVVEEFLAQDEHNAAYAVTRPADNLDALPPRARQIYRDLRAAIAITKAA